MANTKSLEYRVAQALVQFGNKEVLKTLVDPNTTTTVTFTLRRGRTEVVTTSRITTDEF